MAEKKTGSRQFGAFRGVFIPTFLTIMGVIMYLRLGRIVGEAGILGAIAIVVLAVSITISTGLSLSSITTTIKIGAGGAFSIISKTLGIEVGGSIGVPLFIAQTFSVVLYIYGFTEAWRFIFPSHPRIIVLYSVFAILFLLTFINIKYAIKAQIVVFGLVLISLVSIFMGGQWWGHANLVPMVGEFSNMGFWPLFALFFPAVTGLMAGVGMSGELTNPKKQIPKGVISALGVTTAIYLAMVFWFGYSGNAQLLSENNLAIVQLSFFGPLVLAGMLAATFSSALTTLVAAPRVLQALAENSILFGNKFFAKKTESGEPRNSVIFTAAIIAVVISAGSLDSIAPVLTMVFLITYAMINLVVFIAQSIGFVSFRPTFKIPKIIPLYGILGSVFIMLYMNILAGIFSLAVLFLIYLFLVKRHLTSKEGYVRSGMLIALAEWAARKVISLSESKKQVWKPSILLPVVYSRTLLGYFPLIKALSYPNGNLSVLGIDVKGMKIFHGRKINRKQIEREKDILPELVDKFGEEGIFTSFAYISVKDYTEGIATSLQAMEGQFFHPNILFLPFNPKFLSENDLKDIFPAVENANAGLMIFQKDEELGLGSEEDIHVWLPEQALEGELENERYYDLAMLTSYQLHRNWTGKVNLWMCTSKENEDKAKRFMKQLIYESRFPSSTNSTVSIDTFNKTLRNSPRGDIHIIPFLGAEDLKKKRKQTENIRRSFLFVQDSKREDILA